MKTVVLSFWVACQSLFTVVDDPYQFETVADEYLEREIERFEIRQQWVRLNDHELSMLNILKCEREKRERLHALIKELDGETNR